MVVLIPPLITLLPVAVMSDGLPRSAAAGAVVLLGAAIALGVSSLPRSRSQPERAERHATAALLLGVAGGMLARSAVASACNRHASPSRRHPPHDRLTTCVP